MLTLKELKKRVPVAENRGLVMGSVELLHSGAEIVVKETVDNGVAISVFDNGYVLYEEDKHRTVFRLHDCSGYEYKHSETEVETLEKLSLRTRTGTSFHSWWEWIVWKQADVRFLLIMECFLQMWLNMIS